eukprot:TRINITY_DN40297_c0_g1_i1.p1 TRINITY_DN40297_c0_g1~~TRINITY_DN40297_c0_g1_i1.p1  ORF type:complete len:348 (-),score=62.83 TRINITY_DN40297_c0_g1_i1:96-1115(-)
MASPNAGAEELATAQNQELTPGFAAAVLNSPNLLRSLCARYVSRFDRNKDGVLQLAEVMDAARTVHQCLELPFQFRPRLNEVTASVKACSASGAAALTAEEFPAWLTQLLRRTLEAGGHGTSPSAHAALGVDPSTSNEELSLYVSLASGDGGIELEVHGAMQVAELKSLLAPRLGIGKSYLRLLHGSDIIGPDDRSLASFGLGLKATLCAVVVPLVTVERHVYEPQHTVPPLPGAWHKQSDKVELLPDVSLWEQRDAIRPDRAQPRFPVGGGFPRMNRNWGVMKASMRPPQVMAVPTLLPGAKPPSQWPDSTDAKPVSWSRTAADMFGGGNMDVAVIFS